MLPLLICQHSSHFNPIERQMRVCAQQLLSIAEVLQTSLPMLPSVQLMLLPLLLLPLFVSVLLLLLSGCAAFVCCCSSCCYGRNPPYTPPTLPYPSLFPFSFAALPFPFSFFADRPSPPPPPSFHPLPLFFISFPLRIPFLPDSSK